MQTDSSCRFKGLGPYLLREFLHHLDYKSLISSCTNRYLQTTVDPQLAPREDKFAFVMLAENHFKQHFPTEDWPGNFACYICCRVRGPEQFATDQLLTYASAESLTARGYTLTTLRLFCIRCGVENGLHRSGMFMSTMLDEKLRVCECKKVQPATSRCAACGPAPTTPSRSHQTRVPTFASKKESAPLLQTPEIATRHRCSLLSIEDARPPDILKRKRLDPQAEPSKRRRTLDASATICTIVGVKATIDNESRLYKWNGSQWHSGGERTIFKDSIPIGYVTEVEVDATLCRISLIRDAQRNFFKAQLGESVLCAGKGEVESAVSNAWPINALLLPNGSRLVYESRGVDSFGGHQP